MNGDQEGRPAPSEVRDDTAHPLRSEAGVGQPPADREWKQSSGLHPADEVNETRTPIEIRSPTGSRAWLIPEHLWVRLREVAYLVHDPEGARREREATLQALRDEVQSSANDPMEQAALRELRMEIFDSD